MAYDAHQAGQLAQDLNRLFKTEPKISPRDAQGGYAQIQVNLERPIENGEIRELLYLAEAVDGTISIARSGAGVRVLFE